MEDGNEKLREEVQELRVEVRRLKRFIECVFLAGLLGVGLIAPQLFFILLVAGGLAFIGLLFSPARRLVFPSLFKNRNWPGYDI